MVQIDFFDNDIVSTLLPVTTMEPDKVCFLIDRRSENSKASFYVREAIIKRLPDTEVEFIPVDIESIEDIQNKIIDIINTNEGLVEYIDLTGGSELMSACGYKVAHEYNITPIYVDFRREHILNVETAEPICDVWFPLRLGYYHTSRLCQISDKSSSQVSLSPLLVAWADHGQCFFKQF